MDCINLGPEARKKLSPGLWSLWDMLRFYAERFVQALDDISAIRVMSRQTSASDIIVDSSFADRLKDLSVQLLEMNLPTTRKSVERLREIVEKNRQVNSRQLDHSVTEIHSRLVDEIGSIYLFSVRNRADALLTPRDLFGTIVTFRLPALGADIEEAAKCLALERSTAAVFHLMRVMEGALKVLAKELDIPYAPSWESYIKQIKDRIGEEHKRKSVKWKRSEPFFRDVLGDLESIKICWRNPTMHIVRRYTLEEAEGVYLAVRVFTMRVGQRMPISKIEKLLA